MMSTCDLKSLRFLRSRGNETDACKQAFRSYCCRHKDDEKADSKQLWIITAQYSTACLCGAISL